MLYKRLYAKCLVRSDGRWQRSSALYFLCFHPGLLKFGCWKRLFLILVGHLWLSAVSKLFGFSHKILAFSYSEESGWFFPWRKIHFYHTFDCSGSTVVQTSRHSSQPARKHLVVLRWQWGRSKMASPRALWRELDCSYFLSPGDILRSTASRSWMLIITRREKLGDFPKGLLALVSRLHIPPLRNCINTLEWPLVCI